MCVPLHIPGFRSRHSDMHDLDHYMMKGRMYFSCTGDDSDNGAPWCAVQVGFVLLFLETKKRIPR